MGIRELSILSPEITMSNVLNYILIFIVLIGIIIGGFFAFKYYYDSQTIEEKNTTYNVYLRTFSKESQLQISTNYSILKSNIVQDHGKTFKNDRIKIEVPLNKSITIGAFKEGYYSAVWNSEQYIWNEDRDVELYLEPHKRINITDDGKFGLNKQIEIYLNLTDYYPDLMICTTWTNSLIFAEFIELEEVEIPTRLENQVNHCYSGIEKSENLTTLKLEYDFFRSLNHEDSVRIILIDGDYTKKSFESLKIVYEEDGNDIGQEDEIYSLSI